MKKFILACLLLLPMISAATTPTIIQTDKIIFGRQNSGNVDKVIEFNIGSGDTANPKIKWDSVGSALSFANDGITFSAINSGNAINSGASPSGYVLTANGTGASSFQAAANQTVGLVAQYYIQGGVWTAPASSLQPFSTGSSISPTLLFSGSFGSPQTSASTLPQVTVNSLPAGTYTVLVTSCGYNSTSGKGAWYAVSDGSTITGQIAINSNLTGNNVGNTPITLQGIFQYGSTANHTFSVYGAIAPSSGGTNFLDCTGSIGTAGTTFLINKVL